MTEAAPAARPAPGRSFLRHLRGGPVLPSGRPRRHPHPGTRGNYRAFPGKPDLRSAGLHQRVSDEIARRVAQTNSNFSRTLAYRRSVRFLRRYDEASLSGAVRRRPGAHGQGRSGFGARP